MTLRINYYFKNYVSTETIPKNKNLLKRSTRVRLLYALIKFLVDREVVPPDLLTRKLRIKVPEALSRGMSAPGCSALTRNFSGL
jgi:hypothetical protein